MKKINQQDLALILGILLFVGFLIYIYNRGKQSGLPIADIGDDVVRPGFSPNAIGDQFHGLFAKLQLNADGRIKWLNNFNQLSDGEIKTVYNYYRDKYGSEGKTLTQVLEDAVIVVWFQNNPKQFVLDRLARLQLP